MFIDSETVIYEFCQNGGLDFMRKALCKYVIFFGKDGPVVVILQCVLPVLCLCLQIACLAAIMLPNIQHLCEIYLNFIVMIT
jgi:hypothetical protein